MIKKINIRTLNKEDRQPQEDDLLLIIGVTFWFSDGRHYGGYGELFKDMVGGVVWIGDGISCKVLSDLCMQLRNINPEKFNLKFL